MPDGVAMSSRPTRFLHAAIDASAFATRSVLCNGPGDWLHAATNLKRGIDRKWPGKAPAAGAPVSLPANGNGDGHAATRHANGAAAKSDANGQSGKGHAPSAAPPAQNGNGQAPTGSNGSGAGESSGQVGRRLSDFILGEGLINPDQFAMVLAEQKKTNDKLAN